MNQPTKTQGAWRLYLQLLLLAVSYFLIEVYACLLLKPATLTPLAFGGVWAVLLSCIVILLPRRIGQIFFGITYYLLVLWTMAQIGYDNMFGKLMWLSSIKYAGEGSKFILEVLYAFPPFWWIGGIFLLLNGAGVLLLYPRQIPSFSYRLPCLAGAAALVAFLFALPEIVFQRDNDVWGTRSEYGQSSSWRARYTTMYDTKTVYEICGIYQLTARDFWVHEVYPITPSYRKAVKQQVGQIDEYFSKRAEATENEMTGKYAGKNVVLVLMESMDDWMITEKDTPTLYRMMDEGISFTNFYTPGYGGARTLNSEFCMNTGIYLPTTGKYVFDYVTNDWSQSVASQLTQQGYSAHVFHYNDPNFYSRGVFEPAMGYLAYNCYADYTTDADALYDDCLLFDLPEQSQLFFREDGPTFNTIITRSAHLSYKYNEVLSYYALKQYPEYRGMYGSEEEDCARVKAKLVDDMFDRLLYELKQRGQLENTVIIAMTDHYTYGYKNMEELYAHSGVSELLQLEKVPCFVWSADKPSMQVSKTMNTADLLPTVLNLMGVDSPYKYLGQDIFDPNYCGYVVFPDGSWASQGVLCSVAGGKPEILANEQSITVDEKMIEKMGLIAQNFIRTSNLMLTSDYYGQSQ